MRQKIYAKNDMMVENVFKLLHLTVYYNFLQILLMMEVFVLIS